MVTRILGRIAHRHNAWVVAGGFDEGDKVSRRDGCRGVILQGMKVQLLMAHHGIIEDDIGARCCVIDKAKGRD